MSIDVQPFLDWIVSALEPTLRRDDGAYARHRDGSVDLYGTSDMAVVLFSLDRLPRVPELRDRWVRSLCSFQDATSGHFVEVGAATHVELHVTAYAQAALELFDAEPPHPLRFADRWREPPAVTALIEGLDWRVWAYLESHAGAGLGSIFTNARDRRDPAWFDAYFAALDEVLDPASGMHGLDKPPGGDLDQIGATFHYAFLYEHHHRLLAHADARIDAVLGLQRDGGLWDEANPFWMSLDAVYLLSRASRRSGHRRPEVHGAVSRAVARVASMALGPARHESAFLEHDMASHNLAAVVSLLAEAQSLLGRAEIVSDRPLRLVLDRRPFV